MREIGAMEIFDMTELEARHMAFDFRTRQQLDGRGTVMLKDRIIRE
jgi:hypothetical protein